jgi:hypothetical protein
LGLLVIPCQLWHCNLDSFLCPYLSGSLFGVININSNKSTKLYSRQLFHPIHYPWEEYNDGFKKPRWEKYIDRKRKFQSDSDDDDDNVGANKRTRLIYNSTQH